MIRILMVLTFISGSMCMSCGEAQQKCSYRTGCGNALQAYIIHCASIIQDDYPVDQCPEDCENALIALTSTEWGDDLMKCECETELCLQTKKKMEICRPGVINAIRNDTNVSCDVAQWICGADATCSKALEYYNAYCRTMFDGKKCTLRCKNSISILRKQQKAAKLVSCWCSGKEEFDCFKIRKNMDKLCLNKIVNNSNEVSPLDGHSEKNKTHQLSSDSNWSRKYNYEMPILLLIITLINFRLILS